MRSSRNIFAYWLEWHFLDAPKEILRAWKNFLLFGLYYFSIPILFKTLFSYWRKYKWSYGRGFDIKVYVEAALSNAISRTIGAIIRLFLILIGITSEVMIIFVGLIVFLGWFFLPVILAMTLALGIKILFRQKQARLFQACLISV